MKSLELVTYIYKRFGVGPEHAPASAAGLIRAVAAIFGL